MREKVDNMFISGEMRAGVETIVPNHLKNIYSTKLK